MKEDVQLLVQTRQTQQRLAATIELLPTNDPQNPLQLKISSWDNMLLLFNSAVSPEMVSEMCAKLLMNNMKPERVPELLQKLIEQRDAKRSFYLAAEDDVTFYLQVTDFCDDQQFPRFSLPVRRCGFEDVAKELQEHIKGFRQLIEEEGAEISNKNAEFSAKSHQLIAENAEKTATIETLNEQLHEHTRAAEERYGKAMQQIAQMQQEIAQLQARAEVAERQGADAVQQNTVLTVEAREVGEKAHNLEILNSELTFKLQALTQQEAQRAAQLEEKNARLADLEAQARASSQSIAELKAELLQVQGAMSTGQQEELSSLQELRTSNAALTAENGELKVLAGKLAQKVEEFDHKEAFYEDNIQQLQSQNQTAILSLNEFVQKADGCERENQQLRRQLDAMCADGESIKQQYGQAQQTVASQTLEITELKKEVEEAGKRLQDLTRRAEDAETQLGTKMYAQMLYTGTERQETSLLQYNSGNKRAAIADSSILSEYRDILKSSSHGQRQHDEGSTFKQFDMSKYLRDLALPKPQNDRLKEIRQQGEEGKQLMALKQQPSCSANSNGSNPSANSSISLSPVQKSSLSSETRNIVNKYIKNEIQPKDLEIPVSSTSDELEVYAAELLPAPVQLKKAEVAIKQEIMHGEDVVEKNDSELDYYMKMLGEEVD